MSKQLFIYNRLLEVDHAITTVSKPWRCDNCGKQFKKPPLAHLKNYEGCRRAAKSKGSVGYSNILQTSSPGKLTLS